MKCFTNRSRTACTGAERGPQRTKSRHRPHPSHTCARSHVVVDQTCRHLPTVLKAAFGQLSRFLACNLVACCRTSGLRLQRQQTSAPVEQQRSCASCSTTASILIRPARWRARDQEAGMAALDVLPPKVAAQNGCSRCFSSCTRCVHVCCLLSQGGRTPLHHAAAGNHYDVVRMLLECKAEVNTRDEVRAWIGNIHVQGSADDARLEVGRQEWDDGDSCKGVRKQSCPCFRRLGNLFCRFLERDD